MPTPCSNPAPSKYFQRTEDDRHLHLICFIAHQFYRLQDTLMDILFAVVQTVSTPINVTTKSTITPHGSNNTMPCRPSSIALIKARSAL